MRSRHRFSRRLADDRRGNVMIEFALALPILFLLLVGLLDLGRLSLQKSALLQGAREGAQYGIMAPDELTNINTTAQNATGLTGASATSSTFCECSSAAGTTVSCTAMPSPCTGGATRKKYLLVTTTSSFDSVLGATTTTFGLNGPHGWSGAWTPPTTLSATVTMTVP